MKRKNMEPPKLELAKMVSVTDIDLGERHRKDMGDLDALAASIREVGLLQPVVVTGDKRFITDGKGRFRLVAGERRLRAVVSLGWQTVPAYLVTRLEDAAGLLKAERDENICRKEFTPSEAVALGKALEELERPAAEARKKAGVNQHTEPSGKIPEGSTGEVRDKVAEAVGMSGRTYEKAKAVVEAAAREPDLRLVVEEMDRTGKVDPAFKKVKRTAAKPTKRKRKRPLAFHLLDSESKAILGKHLVVFDKREMKALLAIHVGDARFGVARMIADRRADSVAQAKGLLDGEPTAQAQGAPAAESAPAAPTGPAKPYDVMDDVRAFRDLCAKLRPNWTREENKAVLRNLFHQLANEV